MITVALLAGCSSGEISPGDLDDTHIELGKRLVDSPEQNIKEGLFLLHRGALTAATDQFNRALQKDSQNSYFHYLVALTYHLRMIDGEAAQRDLAEQGYLLAIALDQSNWLATYQLALFYQDTRRWTDALEFWLKTRAFRRGDPEVLRNAVYSAYYARDLTIARNLLADYEKVETDRMKYDELATVVLAAAGEEGNAGESLARLPADIQNRLSARVSDWSVLHKTAQTRFRKMEEAQNDQAATQRGSSGQGDEYGDYSSPDEFASSGNSYDSRNNDYDSGDEYEEESEPLRALAVDVVIVRTTEEIGASRGINVLKELQLALGVFQGEAGYSNSRLEETNTSSSSFIDSEGNSFAGDSNIDFRQTDIISRAISVPTITYSMNIANVTGTRNEVLARPTLIAQDGQSSSFFSGSHINAVAVGGSNSDGATESIDVDVGVLLSISADFHSDKEFTLRVEAERTFLQEPNRSAVTFPLFVSYSKTRAEATVRMRFGQSLILSGLSEKETSRSRDAVPLLGDIPLIQYLFNSRSTRDFQSSVVLLITPHPPQYVYSDEEGTKPLSELQGLFGTHWQPYPNITQVFQHMESNRLFREFRTGDVRVEKWLTQESFSNRLKVAQFFIFEI